MKGPVISGSVRLAPGLGLTNRFIIDQHFRQRDRLGRLITALAYNPFAIGIGLDEDTAAFIGPDETVEVEGSGGVTVVDASDVSYSSISEVSEGQPVCVLGLRLHILVAGATFNLHTRIWRGREGSGPAKRDKREPHQARRSNVMRILDRSVYVGPSLYARFPVIRLELDLGPLEAWPTGRLGPGLSTPWLPRCPASPSTAALIRNPEVFSGACAKTRAPGSATSSSTSPSNCRIWRARKSPSARRAARAARGLYRGLRIRAARRGYRGGRSRIAAAVFAPARGDPAGGFGTRRLELGRGAR